jgi:hypothetical protein
MEPYLPIVQSKSGKIVLAKFHGSSSFQIRIIPQQREGYQVLVLLFEKIY